jgi:hypothetical protein
VAQVLGPRLEAFRVQPQLIGQLNQSVPQRMRVAIGQAGESACFAENLADRIGIRPRRAIERHRAECEIVPGGDLSFREQRVVGSEALLLAKESYPVDDDLPDVVADWKEPSREGLCPLGADVTSVLLD